MTEELAEIRDNLLVCEPCGRYMTTDRELAPMPATHPAPNSGSMADPLPAIYALGTTLACQPCAHRLKSEWLLDLGYIVPQGECSVCDEHFWASPTMDPGGPVARHNEGASHGQTHCTCGRPGCNTTD